MSLRIHNSETQQLERFQPQDPSRVTVYVCGPTVYNYAHIGNARPAVVFDLLRRVLKRHYKNVIFARNFTDVDDKINQTASELGVPIGEITRRFETAYQEDMGALNVELPTLEPRATEHISEMVAMIQTLVDKGHAYAAEQHVLFDVTSYDQYGSVSHRQLEDMVAGARVEVAPYKKHAADFVLWKPSSDDLPGWESPWGRGRPGWHIECSAMAAKHLGETIDIHAGGQDLLFPHHENEQAQSVCAHDGSQFVRYWMHNGMLTINDSKMSKSMGNFKTVRELRKGHAGEVLRMALLSAHYRQPLSWSDDLIDQTKRTLDRWYRYLLDHPVSAGTETIPNEVSNALDDDLNTPAALAAISALFNQIRRGEGTEAIAADFLAGANAMGLLTANPNAWFQASTNETGMTDDAIEDLITRRNQARAAKDFPQADELRDELARNGIAIEDSAGETRWKRA